MGLKVRSSSAGAPPTPRAPPADEELEETDEQFEARIYGALLDVAAATNERTRSQLGMCVLMRPTYAAVPELVKEAIRDFIDAAEL
ncbi:MAG: hypothetical protein ABIR60_08535 [Allosphingosinicella sp.]